MSRLCRLKTASHGDDGQWAYDEIVSLRKQRDELLAALDVVRETVTRAHAGCAHVASGAHCNEARQLARASIRNLDTALLIITSVKELK